MIHVADYHIVALGIPFHEYFSVMIFCYTYLLVIFSLYSLFFFSTSIDQELTFESRLFWGNETGAFASKVVV